MASHPKVIVFGASGNVGNYIVPALIEAKVPTTVVTRASSKATFPSGVTIATADYNSLESLTSVIKGHDVVVSLVAARASSSQELVVDAAVAAGATYFLPSEYGHDGENEEINRLLPHFSKKGAVREHLKTKEKDGLTWTSLFTALFFDWVSSA